MHYVENVIKDLLTMIYQYLGISVILSIMIIIIWNQAEKNSWKAIWNGLKCQLREKHWKRRIVFVLYIVFILQRTIFNRSPWGNPLGNVIGEWGLDINGQPNYEMYENIMLFFPMIPIAKLGRIDKNLKCFEGIRILFVPFIFSLAIETVQLFTRAGTFQLSDIVYNTIGGLMGGMVYWIVYQSKKIINSKGKDS